MGSTGTGKFGTYDNNESIPKDSNEKNSKINLQKENLCEREIGDVILEDVEIHQYYKENEGLPDVGENVYVLGNKFKGRIVVAHTMTNQILGNLPTEYNYLFQCIQLGYSYIGVVAQSIEKPTTRLMVKLNVSK